MPALLQKPLEEPLRRIWPLLPEVPDAPIPFDIISQLG